MMLNYGNDSAINGTRRHSSSGFWHIAAVGGSVSAQDLNTHFGEQPVHVCVIFFLFFEERELAGIMTNDDGV